MIDSETGLDVLPCPFCGASPAVCDWVCQAWLECGECGASQFPVSDPDAEIDDNTLRIAAIAAWNRRA